MAASLVDRATQSGKGVAMATQRELFQNFTRGSVLQGPPDLLQDTEIRFLKNSRLDRTKGVISSRPGLSRQTTDTSGLGGSIIALMERTNTAP